MDNLFDANGEKLEFGDEIVFKEATVIVGYVDDRI